jgi:hypothetical protein
MKKCSLINRLMGAAIFLFLVLNIPAGAKSAGVVNLNCETTFTLNIPAEDDPLLHREPLETKEMVTINFDLGQVYLGQRLGVPIIEDTSGMVVWKLSEGKGGNSIDGFIDRLHLTGRNIKQTGSWTQTWDFHHCKIESPKF